MFRALPRTIGYGGTWQWIMLSHVWNQRSLAYNTISRHVIPLSGDRTDIMWIQYFFLNKKTWPVVVQEHKCVTVNATGLIATRENEIFIYILYFHFFAVLNCATQHALLLEFGGKWGTECLNFPLPNLLYSEYSVKLITIIKC